MTKLKGRLSDRSGVSILYALLFFLVASMVAVVILDASVTATKRVRSEQLSQQANLTLASGGKLLRRMLTDSSVTITVPQIGTDDEGNPVYGPEEFTGSGPLGSVLARAVEVVTLNNSVTFRSSDDGHVNRDIVITVSVAEAEGTFSDVTMTFQMDRKKEAEAGHLEHQLDYVITGQITAQNSDQLLRLEAYVDVPPDELDNPKVLRWQSPTLKGG